MPTGATVITWGGPIPGREMKALEVFGKALAFMDELAKEGRIHGHKEYFAVTGPSPSGFMIIEGDVEELLRLEANEDNLKLRAAASQIVQNFSAQVYSGGSEAAINEGVTNVLGVYAELGIT